MNFLTLCSLFITSIQLIDFCRGRGDEYTIQQFEVYYKLLQNIFKRKKCDITYKIYLLFLNNENYN